MRTAPWHLCSVLLSLLAFLLGDTSSCRMFIDDAPQLPQGELSKGQSPDAMCTRVCADVHISYGISERFQMLNTLVHQRQFCVGQRGDDDHLTPSNTTTRAANSCW